VQAEHISQPKSNPSIVFGSFRFWYCSQALQEHHFQEHLN